jgi:hypothetical protein
VELLVSGVTENRKMAKHLIGFGKMKCTILSQFFDPYVYSIERVARNPGVGCVWSLAFLDAF